MAKQLINLGTAGDDTTGDFLYDAFGKANNNFNELYARATLVVSTAGVGQQIGAAFTTVAMGTVTVDSEAGYSTSTSIYTVKKAGYYLIIGKIRWPDNDTVQAYGYGLGMDIQNVDNPEFFWLTSSANADSANRRQGGLNVRVMQLNVNDQLRMYAYMPTGNRNVIAAAMSVTQLF